MDSKTYLILSCVPYLIASGYVCYAMGARHFKGSALNIFLMALGFVLHTLFLYTRGEMIGHCPLTNLFETVAFISWAIVLNYLIIGHVYRLSLLGTFTAPLVLFLNLFALLVPNIDQPRQIAVQGWLLEFHAAMSVLAYGTLALSAVAAAMFLVVNHSLKIHHISPFLMRLPPVGKLDLVSFHIAVWGFALLTVGIASGFGLPQYMTDYVKVIWSLMVWVFYAVIIMGRYMAKVSPVKFSILSALGYAFVLLTFWGVNSLTELHHFGK